MEKMITEDWELAIQMSRMRTERFTDYEKKAVKVFKLVQEDEENDILKFLEHYVKEQKVDDFHRARLIMVILSRLGTLKIPLLIIESNQKKSQRYNKLELSCVKLYVFGLRTWHVSDSCLGSPTREVHFIALNESHNELYSGVEIYSTDNRKYIYIHSSTLPCSQFRVCCHSF